MLLFLLLGLFVGGFVVLFCFVVCFCLFVGWVWWLVCCGFVVGAWLRWFVFFLLLCLVVLCVCVCLFVCSWFLLVVVVLLLCDGTTARFACGGPSGGREACFVQWLVPLPGFLG